MDAVGMGEFFESRNESEMATAMSGGSQMTGDINVFSGLKFLTEDEKKKEYSVELTKEQRMAMANLSGDEITKMMESYSKNKDASYDKNLEK